MKYMRIMPQGLQVPEITYVKDGKFITIQGAIHIASKKFYNKIIDRVKGYDGETHLEGIKATDTQSSNKDILNNLYNTMAAFSNLSHQKDFINKNLVDNKKIFNHDLEDQGISDLLLNKKIIKSFKEIETEKILDFASSSFTLNIGSSPLFNILIRIAGKGSLPKEIEEVILHKRNIYAIDKALESKRNVYLFWGANHLEGMNEILLENGYSILNIKWLTAIPSLRLQRNHKIRKDAIIDNLMNIQSIISSTEQ